MYEVQNVKFSYGTEGRGYGQGYGFSNWGFVPPASEIQPSGEENWAALVALCHYVYEHT